MADYRAPVHDIRFALDLVGLADVMAWPDFAAIDASSIDDMLGEFGRFSAEVLAPLDRVGDTVGSRHDPDTDAVTTPPGFRDAYQRYVEAGWGSVPADPAYGGGGFPWMVGLAMQEMQTSANMAFTLCTLLTQGAIDALEHHGSEIQRETYLAHMVAGEWTGTMNLTEPEAGSDVGALRTRAVPQADGSWRVFGQKIFITYGEHDMVDNIVHLVLARTPDAPPGTKGISLFLVPKFVLDADGKPGARNDVRCASLEHKLGIHASPTCVMLYGDAGEGAVGELVGEINGGMRAMFTMMNNARLSVGVQGLAVAERAYQDAVAYALERVQGKVVVPEAGSTIVGHADVRRMLLTMRSSIDALRALCYLNAAELDRSRHHLDEHTRSRAQERADLLTPLSKAWGTDVGVEVASTALQVFGGMGYVEETGIAQRLRDVRITPIYEGTNAIQALDLIGRKLPMRGGAVIDDLLSEIEETAEGLAADGLIEMGTALAAAVGATREATDWLLTRTDPVDAMTGATPYLRMLATTVGGWLLARQALAVQPEAPDDPWAAAKLISARWFAEQILPAVGALTGPVTAGKDRAFALDPSQFASR
jgi:alkylation response protein AidB-like acyl-CoA dehydrogenase